MVYLNNLYDYQYHTQHAIAAQRVEKGIGQTQRAILALADVGTVIIEITNHLPYGSDFLLPTRICEYVRDDASSRRRHPSQVMRSAIFRIVSGDLLVNVNNRCNFWSLQTECYGRKGTMSEVNLCLGRETAEQLLYIFKPTEIKE